MKLSAYRASAKPSLMIIPMIDIIFFLLVFYMMTTLYMTEQRAIPVRLPGAATAAVRSGPDVTVTVTAADEVFVGERRVEAARLAEALRVYTAVEGTRFAVKADRDARHGTVVMVLDALRLAGAADASIDASPGSGP